MTEIIGFEALDAQQYAAAAAILRAALVRWNAYQMPGEAEGEVATFQRDPERLALAAVDGGRVQGWIGAIRVYDFGWELHPLVVAPEHQRRGIGTFLLGALEARAREDGILTLYAGSDDPFGGTTAYGRDLFPAIAETIRSLDVIGDHPIGFYRKAGFAVVGVLPEVNGPGKPDILLAKRLSPSSA